MRRVALELVAVVVAVVLGWTYAVGITERHLAADKRLQAQCTALAEQSTRVITAAEAMIARPDSTRTDGSAVAP